MNRYLLTLVLVIMGWSFPCTAQVHRGDKSVGVSVGYATRNESLSTGLGLSYSLSNSLRLNPEADYIFKRNGQDGFLFNIDLEMPMRMGQTQCYLYPLLGLSYTSWNQKIEGSVDDTSQRTTRMGLNLGAGLEYYIKPPMKVFIEGKWNAVKRYNTGLFSIGVAYVF